MKYMKQFGIIILIALAGEFLEKLLPLPVPGSIYGLGIMLALLMSGLLAAVVAVTTVVVMAVTGKCAQRMIRQGKKDTDMTQKKG